MGQIQSIDIQPSEKGAAVVTIAPTDENGNTLTIGQLKSPAWQLMKKDGTVINNRSFSLCAITSLTWVLKGDDLAMFGNQDSGYRRLSVQALYDSDVGTDLPLNDECSFYIKRLLGQADEM